MSIVFRRMFSPFFKLFLICLKGGACLQHVEFRSTLLFAIMGAFCWVIKRALGIWMQVGIFVMFMSSIMKKDGKNIIQFLNHSKQTFSFGKFINHSKPHFNVIPKVFFHSNGQPEIMFISIFDIDKGDKILFDYSALYKGVKRCFTSCKKCKFLFK